MKRRAFIAGLGVWRIEARVARSRSCTSAPIPQPAQRLITNCNSLSYRRPSPEIFEVSRLNGRWFTVLIVVGMCTLLFLLLVGALAMSGVAAPCLSHRRLVRTWPVVCEP